MKDGMVILTYVDDLIIPGQRMKGIDCFLYSMQHGSENVILTDEGDVNKFLGIEITHNKDYSFELSQPFLIDHLLSLLGMGKNEFNTSTTTTVSKGILQRDMAVNSLKVPRKYRKAVGIPSYIQGHTRPDISMSVHQTSRLCNNPRICHKKAAMRLGHYILGPRKRGIIYRPDKYKGMECYVDSDLAVNYR